MFKTTTRVLLPINQLQVEQLGGTFWAINSLHFGGGSCIQGC